MQTPSAPGSGDRIEWPDLLGRLLYISVTEHVRDVSTSAGLSDAIRANVTVLDGPNKGHNYDDALIFPKVLRSQLVKFVGGNDPTVLGRLAQGEAKPGKTAPWILNPPTEADLDIGRKYETYTAVKAADEEEPF